MADNMLWLFSLPLYLSFFLALLSLFFPLYLSFSLPFLSRSLALSIFFLFLSLSVSLGEVKLNFLHSIRSDSLLQVSQ